MAARFTTTSDRFIRTTGLLDYNGQYTIMAWVYVDSASGYCSFLSIQSTDFNNQDTFQQLSTGGSLTLQSWKAGSSAGSATAGTLAVGSWHHYAMVREAPNVLKAYYDGALLMTATTDITGRAAANRMGIGAFPTGGELNGRFAAVKAWNTVINAEQMQYEMALYRARRRLDGVWGIWPVFPGSGMRTRDFSGNGRDWTEQGTVTDVDHPPVSWGAEPLLVRGHTVAAPAGPDVYSIAARQQSGADGSGHLGHRVLSY